MKNTNMPPCFCDEEAMVSCDWTVGLSINCHRPGHPEAPSGQVQWELAQIPQLLAQVVMQAMVASANEKGLEVYAAWQRGCLEGNSPDEMIERVRSML